MTQAEAKDARAAAQATLAQRKGKAPAPQQPAAAPPKAPATHTSQPPRPQATPVTKSPAKQGEWLTVKHRRKTPSKETDRTCWVFLQDYQSPHTGRKVYRGDARRWREHVQAQLRGDASLLQGFTHVQAPQGETRGGIAVTWEHDLHLYSRRVALNRALYGTPEFHRFQLQKFMAA